MRCRICASSTSVFARVPHSATAVSRLYPTPTQTTGTEITVYLCNICEHFQIPYLNADDYYDNYVMSASFAPMQKALHRAQIETLLTLGAKRQDFVEIGCGDGTFLSMASSYFESTLGIEPSKSFHEMCKAKGLNVLNTYLSPNTKFDKKFHAFASRQVFEHLDNPVEVLSIAREITMSDAVGLIEVPNAQKMIDENRYFDLFTDHVNYYTPRSLCILARKAGFQILNVRESFNGDYLEAYLRNKNYQSNLQGKRDFDVDFLLRSVGHYRTCALWGAGAKAQALMTVLGETLNPKYVFDSDRNKHGRYLVNCKVPVTAPEVGEILDIRLIIISAVSYQDEILGELQRMGYLGDVLTLEGSPQIRSLAKAEDIAISGDGN